MFPRVDLKNIIWGEKPSYIPVVNFKALLTEHDNHVEMARGTEKQILHDTFVHPGPGVMYLSNSSVTEPSVIDLVNTCRTFLNSPPDVLESYYAEPGELAGLSVDESTEAVVQRLQGVKSSQKPHADQVVKFSHVKNPSKNKWPNPLLREQSEALSAKAFEETRKLLEIFIDSHPPEEEQVEPLWRVIETLEYIFRQLSYFDVDSSNTAPSRMYPHVDATLMTWSYRVPAENGFSALQYKINHQFKPVPSLRHMASVHIGEPLQSFYQTENRRLTAPVHYVAMPPEQLRGPGSLHTSLLLFVNPHKDAKIPHFKDSYYKNNLAPYYSNDGVATILKDAHKASL